MLKLQTQEYHDDYACYLLPKACLNDSFKTLVNAAELCIFSTGCTFGRDFFQATRYEQEIDDRKYKFLPHNLV